MSIEFAQPLKRGFVTPPVLFVCLVVNTSLFIATAGNGPSLLLPIPTPPGWASWFDLYAIFPVLSAGILLTFRRLDWPAALIIGGLVTLPMVYHSLNSYYWFYDSSGYTGSTSLGLLIGGVGVSVALTIALFFAPRVGWGSSQTWSRVERPLAICALVSVGFAVVEGFLLRPISSASSPLQWAGDIGITVAWGGFDIAHHVNPFTTGLLPWGGVAAPPYGPISFLLAAPFSVFSIGMAAHLSSLMFAILDATMISLIVRSFWRERGRAFGLLYLALPATSWAIAGTVTSHFMVTLFILIALFLAIQNRPFFAGTSLSIATLTLYFPALLLIPFLLFLKRGKVRFALGFIPLTIIGIYLTTVTFAGHGVAGGTSSIASGGTTFIGFSQLGSAAGGVVIAIALLLILSVALLFLLEFARSERTRLLVGSAVVLLFTPAIIGYTYAAFYVWSGAVAVAAIASVIADREQDSTSFGSEMTADFQPLRGVSKGVGGRHSTPGLGARIWLARRNPLPGLPDSQARISAALGATRIGSQLVSLRGRLSVTSPQVAYSHSSRGYGPERPSGTPESVSAMRHFRIGLWNSLRAHEAGGSSSTVGPATVVSPSAASPRTEQLREHRFHVFG